MKAAGRVLVLAGLCALGATVTQAGKADALRSADSFDGIADRAARSEALFQEAGKVIQHPRCLNCHPSTRNPTQGDTMHPHVPPISAAGGHGEPGLPCTTCHGPANRPTFAAGVESIPGDPHWALAPASMAWQGRSLAAICRQIKDRRKNGGRSLDQIAAHMAEDHLVGWAWRPGAGRTPAPGSQEIFGGLISAWIETGAQCPR